ncbi:MAG: alginate lyase family protein [Planctomycetota bacterium]|jgi:hypothetical protein
MRGKCIAILLAGIALSCAASPSGRAGEGGSCAAVCRNHPERVKKLFAALNLDGPGLGKVKAAARQKDWPKACEELVAYYRDGKTAEWLRVEAPKPGTGRHERAEAVLKDTFTIQAVTHRQPRLKNGRLNWQHNGPRGDREWGWLLNRHPHFTLLLGAWRKTGNPAYPRCFDEHVRDWVTSRAYSGKSSGDAQWRGLEVGLRVRGSWPRSFYGFQAAKEFTPAARILMLSSIPDHAHNLRNYHAGSSNWTLMQMTGLANAAACWPEFKDGPAWFDYATKVMLKAIDGQIYPDGAQKELTSHYHQVCIDNFDPFVVIAGRLGREMPAKYVKTVENMWTYLAYTMRPHGFGLLNNDSDLNRTRRRIAKAAERYKREDWTYIVTNGKEGKKPEGLPSRVFPWAGQAVMRSGWEKHAHWAFLDVGPAGISHRHKDRLHISVSAFGRDLLVDGGRYWYKWDKWRAYFTTAPSHNVVLVDGCGQKMGPYDARKPMTGNYRTAPDFDYVRGKIDQGFVKLQGSAAHARAVLHVRGRFWVVFDRVTGDRARRLQILWHFHPECTVKTEGAQALSTDAGEGNLRIVPAGGPEWKLESVKGREKPSIQGWYSPTYNVKQPNSTAVYSAKAGKAAAFAWVLLPARGEVPAVKAEALPAPGGALRVRVTPAGEKACEVAVRFEGKAPVPLSGGLKLEGDCAVLGIGEKPLVAGGRVVGKAGEVLAEHACGR